MTVLLILHYLHLLLASIWIGFLVAALVASFRGRDQVLAVQKTLGPAAMGSLLLLAIVGIGIALAKYDAALETGSSSAPTSGELGRR